MRSIRVSKEEFIKRAIKIHGHKYDYSKIEYINSNTKVKIICPIHGIFLQKPFYHTKRENGCRLCRDYNRTKTSEDFIKEGYTKHGNKFNYSKTNYVNAVTKIIIECKIHGEFEIRARDHIRYKYGGCSKCCTEQSKYNLFKYDTWEELGKKSNSFDSFKVYLIKCFNDDESFYKIGKTFTSVKTRYFGTKIPYMYEIIREINGEAREISILEETLHRFYKNERYIPKIPFKGDTECYNINIDFNPEKIAKTKSKP